MLLFFFLLWFYLSDCKVALEGLFPSFFFGFAFQTVCLPSSKFIIWVFELQIFKLQILLTKVHTIIDSTFSNSLRSTISGFNIHSNELTGMHLGLIPRQSCRDLFLWRTLLRMRYPSRNLLVFTFELKYQAVRHWYAATWSYELRRFSLRKSSSRRYKIMFCSRSKLSLLRDPASSSTRTMASYLYASENGVSPVVNLAVVL